MTTGLDFGFQISSQKYQEDSSHMSVQARKLELQISD
jgi:hypothetical protein